MLDWLQRLFDGSLVAGGVFLIIGIIGAVLLVLSVILDGIFEVFDFGDGPLSLTTIAAFTAVFGFAAYASIGAGASVTVAGVTGAAAGFAGGAAAWWVSRMVRNAESTTAVTTDELLGSEASVVLAIPANGLGEITLLRHGERVSLAATATEAIQRGARVRISGVLSANSVTVEPILAPEVPAEAPTQAAAPQPEPPHELPPGSHA